MLTSTAVGGFAIDAKGRIVLWNRAAEDILGYAIRDAVGRQCCDLLMGDDEHGNRVCCRNRHVLDVVKPGDFVRSVDMRCHTKTGSPIWINVSTLQISSDKVGGVSVHLVRDVTTTRAILALIRRRLSTSRAPVPQALEGNGALTRRQVEILRLISTGLNTKATAERLEVSPATVRNHVQAILNKLGAHSRLEAVVYATRSRLV